MIFAGSSNDAKADSKGFGSIILIVYYLKDAPPCGSENILG